MCVFKLAINIHGESLDLIVTILLGIDLSAALSIISEKSCIF